MLFGFPLMTSDTWHFDGICSLFWGKWMLDHFFGINIDHMKAQTLSLKKGFQLQIFWDWNVRCSVNWKWVLVGEAAEVAEAAPEVAGAKIVRAAIPKNRSPTMFSNVEAGLWWEITSCFTVSPPIVPGHFLQAGNQHINRTNRFKLRRRNYHLDNGTNFAHVNFSSA